MKLSGYVKQNFPLVFLKPRYILLEIVIFDILLPLTISGTLMSNVFVGMALQGKNQG